MNARILHISSHSHNTYVSSSGQHQREKEGRKVSMSSWSRQSRCKSSAAAEVCESTEEGEVAHWGNGMSYEVQVGNWVVL